MALSNMLREPRREITETVVGLAAIVGFCFLDYPFAIWFQEATGGLPHGGCPWPLGLFVGAIVLVLVLGLAIFVHFVGEEICDALARRGAELRPKQRYQRRY